MRLSYTELAEVYDRFIGEKPRVWRRARNHMLGGVLRHVRSVCELGCGSAITALEFARRGARVFAVDRSPGMCRLAHRKARRAGLAIQVMQADMRNFRLPGAVDLVTCEFHTINHLRHKSEFLRVAQTVARALRPGGYFFFDLAERAMFEQLWTQSLCSEGRGIVMVRHGGYNRRSERGWLEVTLFILDGRRWKRLDGRLEMVQWSRHEVRSSLAKAGFESVRALDSARFFPPSAMSRKRGCQTFYLARKRR